MREAERQIDPKAYSKIGFVASGGAAKALFYHIGVAFALKERGFDFPKSIDGRDPDKYYIDLVVGSSGGSIFASFLANGFDEQEIEQRLEHKEWWSYIVNPRQRKKGDLTGFSYADIFMPNIPLNAKEWKDVIFRFDDAFREFGDKSIFLLGPEYVGRKLMAFTDGVCRLDRLEKYLADVMLTNDFTELREKTGIELYVVATELNNPRKAIFGPQTSPWIGSAEDDFYRDRYLSDSTIARAVTASCAVPGLFKPVEIGGVKYIDGETKKALSTHVAMEQNCDLIFVSHTFTPHIQSDRNEDFGLLDLVHQAFQTLIFQKIQTHKDYHQQKRKVFDYLASEEFSRRTGVTAEQRDEILRAYEEYANFNRKRTYVFIPSPPETFHLDYFNIFPPMLNEIINTGYATAGVVLDLHGIPKLPEFQTHGILNNLGVARRNFRLLKKYVVEKQAMKAHYHKFL